MVNPIYILLKQYCSTEKIEQSDLFYLGKNDGWFYRTNLGRVALQQRNITLNAKQRRLLLLIDHEDFQNLNSEFKNVLHLQSLFNSLST